MNLQDMTPAEIDTMLAEIHERADAPFGRYVAAKNEAAKIARALESGARTVYDADDLARVQGYAAKYRAQYDAIMAEAAPLDAEFTRRGGWTRAFLVLASNGHLHKDMHCSTCYPTTRYGWLPQESGKDEAEIVEGAGSDACTVCYPSAPVVSLSQPRRTLHKTEVEAAKAREAKAAKKAAADAKKAANTLDTPVQAGRYDRITKVTEAKMYLTDGFTWGWSHPSYTPQWRDEVAASLAAKVGTTAEAEIAAAAKRAAKRR